MRVRVIGKAIALSSSITGVAFRSRAESHDWILAVDFDDWLQNTDGMHSTAVIIMQRTRNSSDWVGRRPGQRKPLMASSVRNSRRSARFKETVSCACPEEQGEIVGDSRIPPRYDGAFQRLGIFSTPQIHQIHQN